MLPIRIQEELITLGLDLQSNPRKVQAGMSGAPVYHLGEYALKAHPLSRFEELQRVHWAQQRWARELSSDRNSQSDPFTWVPCLIAWPSLLQRNIATLLVEGDACWECMAWKPGVPLSSIDQVTVSHLQCVGSALGQLHRIARQWSGETQVDQTIDFRMIQRYDLLKRVVQSRFSPQRQRLLKWTWPHRDSSPIHNLLPLVFEALDEASRIADQSITAMQNLSCTASFKHWMHGDAWRGNWLFSHDESQGSARVSGLIDFGQAGLRWPGFDFSRAIGSMAWGQSPLWQHAWESYCEVLGEPGYRIEEALLMHRVSMVLTLVTYIDRMESRFMLDKPSIDRLKEVCMQIKTIALA